VAHESAAFERAGSAASCFVARWKGLREWERDLPNLTVEQLRERLKLAREREVHSDRKGMGRNPKARRDWRIMREQVEAELNRRGA
jgi:hypothetical protein